MNLVDGLLLLTVHCLLVLAVLNSEEQHESIPLPRSLTSPKIIEIFNEELKLKPTLDGKVVATFLFKTFLQGAPPTSLEDLEIGNDDYVGYTLFPLSLGQILRAHKVPEMHLSLNSGNWDYASWGFEEDVGTGGEVWSWMGGDEDSVNERWVALQNSLGGLFCASLSPTSLSSPSSWPKLTFPPTGALPALQSRNGSQAGTYHLRRTTLPSERLCTENLTPFLKLLPCKHQAGLAQLLNPHSLVGADWHGMGIHVRWITDSVERADQVGIELNLVVRSVFDPIRMRSDGKRDWTLESLFGRTVTRICPVATRSVIFVQLPKDQTPVVEPTPQNIDPSTNMATFNISASTKMPINIAYRIEGQYQPPLQPLPASDILLKRIFLASPTTSLQTWKKLRIEINNEGERTVEAIYTEVVPWFVKLYLHTLEITGVGSHEILTYDPSPHPTTLSTTQSNAPSHLSLLLKLPPGKTVLSLDVEFAFLQYTAFVPDAQRGVDIPGGVLRLLNASTKIGGSTSDAADGRIYSSPLLVTLPTPDFSMPYNVIVMSSTVIGFLFANTFNMLVRRIIRVKVD